MKHADGAAASLSARSGYPGLIAPASLKPSGAPGPEAESSRLSGVNRPGLIEAPEAELRRLPCYSYPGLIAPASLKLFHQQPRVGGVHRYPGLIAPASLKRDPVRLPAGRDDRYPGLIAPASLKQRHAGRFRRSKRRRYPGLIAPASLKQLQPAWPGAEYYEVIRG